MTVHTIIRTIKITIKATIISKNWKYCNDIMYDCYRRRWYSDYITISDNQKKMCRREWNKLAKSIDVKLNIII